MTKGLLVVGGAIALAFIPMPSKAEWVAVAESDNVVVYVNDRIQVKAATNEPAFFWAKMDYKKRQPDGIRSAVTYNAVRCNPISSQVTKLITYNTQGAVVESKDYGDTLEWSSPIPGSLLEVAIEAVCN